MAAYEHFIGTLSRLRTLSEEAVVIKIGGNVLPHHEAFCEDVNALWEAGVFPVIVHGGGKAVTEWEKTLGREAKFVPGPAGHGRRCPGTGANGPRR